MKKIYLILSVLAVMSVTACGITKKTLGFTTEGPDESNVKTNQPLVLPPEYNVLPSPKNNQDETSDDTLNNE